MLHDIDDIQDNCGLIMGMNRTLNTIKLINVYHCSTYIYGLNLIICKVVIKINIVTNN